MVHYEYYKKALWLFCDYVCFRNAMINEHVIFLLLVICFWLLLLVLLCFSLLCRLFRKKHSYLVVVFKPLSQRSCCCVHYLPPPRLSIISRPLSARFTLSHCLWFSSTLFLSQSSPSLLILLLFLPFVFSLSADFPPNNLRVRMWMSVPLMSIFNHKWSIWLVCMKDNCELIKIIIS